jgi:hypothetical protein
MPLTMKAEVEEIIRRNYPDLHPLTTEVPIRVNDLPQFQFLKWMTTFRIRKINPATVVPGAYGCVISTAFNDWTIGDAATATQLARADYDFYKKNMGTRVVGVHPDFGGGPLSRAAWEPPDFYDGAARAAATRMMNWNDDAGYDDEKRKMLAVAIFQELRDRGERSGWDIE